MAPAVALEKTAHGGPGARRRNDFDETGADREQHVLEAVLRDACVAVAFLETEDRLDVSGLAREVGKHGITVNSLAPGFTLSENVAKHEVHVRQGEATKMTRAIPRDEKPQDLVGTVSFLASEGASYVTGQVISVNGGLGG